MANTITLRVDSALHKRVMVYCTVNEMTLTQVITELLEHELVEKRLQRRELSAPDAGDPPTFSECCDCGGDCDPNLCCGGGHRD